jgi:hypothetical protein
MPTAFFVGVAGAFVVYCLMYRESRMLTFLADPRRKWPVLVFDLVLYLSCGGLVAAFYAEPKSLREAFIAGCAWQGIAGSLVAGAEMKAYREAEEQRQQKFPRGAKK